MNPAEASGLLNREGRAGFGIASKKATVLKRLGPQQDPNLDRVIASVGVNAFGSDVSIPWEVKVPDPSVQVRVSLAIAPKTAVTPDDSASTVSLGTTTATLWATLRTRAVANQPLFVPTRNIVGTGAAPITIPTDTRLWGYEFELVTVGQNIRGVLTVGAGTATAAYEWHLVVDYASVEEISDEEWKILVNMCGIARGDKILIGGGV
jgi:hypothetical protein